MEKYDNCMTIDFETFYRKESRKVLATLIRLLGDFDLAEEALHDAFAAAMVQWPQEGLPTNPAAWLVSTGRFKAIDQLRRRTRFNTPLEEVADTLVAAETQDSEPIEDDQLRLIFTCCHPSLAPEAQLAMTLREVCGLTTEAIARAFLLTPSTLAQRIVRAKNKIRDANIPYEVPGTRELPERLHSVLQVIYLVFNEGYSSHVGDSVGRTDLAEEAIRLGRLLLSLLPHAEVQGLLALMLLQESRRAARIDAAGELILLEDQDRTRWNQAQIREGCALVEAALRSRQFGVYSLQAAIAAVHAEAPGPAATDWAQIVGLYDALLRLHPSPVVELNRAVAVAMRDGYATGIALIEPLLQQPALRQYQPAYAALGELYLRAGRQEQAQQSLRTALTLATSTVEKRHLEKRLAMLEAGR